MRYPTVLLISIPFLVSTCANHEPAEGRTPAAKSDRQRITIHASGLTFEIPAGWVTYLSREQLADVERPERDEWDTDFARARNAAIPFDRCVAHVGSEPWGEEGRHYNDLQVSVYELPGDQDDLENRIVKAIRAAVRPDKVRRETRGAWRRILVNKERFYFDYGATAIMDFRLRRFGDRTVIFVFMHTDFPNDIADEIPRILGSVEAPNPGVEEPPKPPAHPE